MSRSHWSFPDSRDFVLADVRLPVALVANAPALPQADGLLLCDLRIEAGKIAAIAARGTARDSLPLVALDDGIVLPRLVDIHTHLDKGQIWARRPNPDGTTPGARAAVPLDREAFWTADDLRLRMDFSLRCAFAHGTGALRTHIDTVGGQGAISWPVFAEMRAAWAGRIDLQAVALFPADLALDEEKFRGIVDLAVAHGGILGGTTFLGGPPDARLAQALDRLFEAAEAHGLDLDFHVDESASLDARSLRAIAETALRRRFKGRILTGHCCALALQPDEERRETIAKVADAGIAVVSLPMCNLYLQDRMTGRTPRWRGVAPLHELVDAGVKVMVASDNVRDPYYAYGDLDLVEVYREALRILHLDHAGPHWPKIVASTPADIMRLPAKGRIAPLAPADLILTRARSFNELLTRPQSDRAVLVAGRPISTVLPDYRELDAILPKVAPIS